MKHLVKLPQGTISYSEDGTGEALVFLHPIVTNSTIWRKIVPRLSKDFRCVAPDWPMGGHSIPMEPDADLSLPGLARMVVDFMDAIDLPSATLVGNDTGGAVAQQVAVDYPDRVDRLVLCSCELYERFLPPQFKPLEWAALIPGSVWLASQVLRLRWFQALPMNYGGSMRQGLPDRSVMDAYLRPARESGGVRRDFRKFLRAVDSRYTLHTAEALKSFDKPVLVAWAGEDKLFPLEYPRRFVRSLPNARLEIIPDSRTFIPEDQPEALSDAIASFARQPLAAVAAGETL